MENVGSATSADSSLLGALARVAASNASQQALCAALCELCERALHLRGFAIVIREGREPLVAFSRHRQPELRLGAVAMSDGVTAIERHDPNTVIAVPLAADGNIYGAVVIEAGAAVAQPAIDLIETATLFIGAPLADRRLSEQAERDALTRLGNGRALERALRRSFHDALRTREPVAVIVSDLDFFNAYNARYGNLAGDLCLQDIARTIQTCVARPSSFLARSGEDQFCALLPGCSEDDAAAVAQAIHAAIERLDKEHRGSSLGRMSLSTGFAATVPQCSEDMDRLLSLAAARLSEAKSSGRNRYAGSNPVTAVTAPAFERFEAQNNFPHVSSSFVGRERETKAMLESFSRSRLVTIVGGGGVGKTRLALHVGRRLAERYRDGARFVEIASLRHSTEIVSALARAFAIPEVTAPSALDMLMRDLQEIDALVIFDTCERLLRDCADIVARMLAQCPNLRVLAASREALQLPGEIAHRLRGLTPVDGQRLFQERASVHESERAAGSERLVKTIITHLDGNPLAIELVAAHLHEFGFNGLLSALERHGGVGFTAHSSELRQGSLHHAIDWSFTRLNEAQQQLLLRLSVFAFGGRTDAVRAICAGGALDAADVDEALHDLDRKSLIELSPARDEFRIAEPTAHYARMRLRTEVAGPLLTRFGRWYAERSSLLVPDRGDPAYRSAVMACPAEVENYLLALRRLVTERRDLKTGAELCNNACRFLGRIGRYADARRWLTVVLEHAGEYEPALLAKLEHTLAVTAYGQADADAAERHASRALAIFERLGDVAGQARSLQTIGSSLYVRGRYDQARGIYQRCLEVYRTIGDEHAMILALANLAAVEIDGYCDAASAIVYIEDALRRARSIEPDYKLGVCLLTLGQIRAALGDVSGAFAAYEESATILDGLGHPVLAMTLSLRARLHLKQGQLEQARLDLRRAVQIYVGAEAPHYVAYCIESSASLATALGRHDVAAYLLGFSDAYRKRNSDLRANADVPDYQDVLDRARAALGIPVFDEAYQRGRASTLGIALREAVIL